MVPVSPHSAQTQWKKYHLVGIYCMSQGKKKLFRSDVYLWRYKINTL